MAIIAICLFFTHAMHPLHVSVSEFDYNNKSNSFEIAIKIFLDDFEEALSKDKITIKLESNSQDTTENKVFMDYISKRFKIQINDKNVQLNFVGNESDHEAIWLYFEIKDQKETIKKMNFENTILMELFDDQSNLIHVSYKGQKSSVACRSNARSKMVNF